MKIGTDKKWKAVRDHHRKTPPPHSRHMRRIKEIMPKKKLIFFFDFSHDINLEEKKTQFYIVESHLIFRFIALNGH